MIKILDLLKKDSSDDNDKKLLEAGCYGLAVKPIGITV
jgi:hypothetical protein